MAAARNNPSAHRRRLRAELRRARAAAEMTQQEAADKLEWSLSKLIRIEAGTVGVSVTDLKAMLALYRMTDPAIADALAEAARGSRGQSWWSRYRDVVSPQLAQYFASEDSASVIRALHPYLVPGLLQTDGYARELLHPRVGLDRANRLVETREERREGLSERQGTVGMTFVFGEEALHRWIGGPAVMLRQLEHLLHLVAQPSPSKSVKIVPFQAGSHPGLYGSFTLLSFKDFDDDLIFLESAAGDMVSRDDQDLIAEFTEHFETTRSLALPDDQAAELIRSLVKGFEAQA
jgi:transcriptional regulator with XRE-family HTH domain